LCFFCSSKKLHEDAKDKEGPADAKEEKKGFEGVYASAATDSVHRDFPTHC
jgi:hypothetical protein